MKMQENPPDGRAHRQAFGLRAGDSGRPDRVIVPPYCGRARHSRFHSDACSPVKGNEAPLPRFAESPPFFTLRTAEIWSHRRQIVWTAWLGYCQL
jgi:hypothetical protein